MCSYFLFVVVKVSGIKKRKKNNVKSKIKIKVKIFILPCSIFLKETTYKILNETDFYRIHQK